jgi:hypothetical protein
MNAGEVLNLVKDYVEGYGKDNLPVVVAVADLKNDKIFIELTIQRGYPLDGIWRDCGRPFGRYIDSGKLESDLNTINYHKGTLETHENLCKALAYSDRGIDKMSIALTSGAGNIFQNQGCVAWVRNAKVVKNNKVRYENKIFKVARENLTINDSFSCLVEYAPGPENHEQKRHGIENLSFAQNNDIWQVFNNGCDWTEKINWAVSGYPLILNGDKVPLRATAEQVSDFRHIWRLPMLHHSLTEPLFMGNPPAGVEFYYGLRWLLRDKNFNLAVEEQQICLPFIMDIDPDWVTNFIDLHGINNYLHLIINRATNQLIFDRDRLARDFRAFGYEEKNNQDEVTKAGDFSMDGNFVFFYLKPAIYPHHIIGLKNDGRDNFLYDISITGKSGRSGISIANAKNLCEKIGMNDALIIDNGFDVIAKMNEGLLICHKDNTKPPRLTAAVHIGCVQDSGPGPYGNHLEGIELAYSTINVPKETPPKAPSHELNSLKVSLRETPLPVNYEIVNIFISYSHKDENLKNELYNHLTMVKEFIVWHDRDMLAGSALHNTIMDKLDESEIVLALFSSDFFASNYCMRELDRALKHLEKLIVPAGKVEKVIPVILRPCMWQAKPRLAGFIALPTDGKPVTGWRDLDEGFYNVACGILKVAKEIRKLP